MDRIDRLLQKLKAQGVGAAVLHSAENMRYFTGYTGEGCVFLCPAFSAILTDFRYIEIAGIESPSSRVLRTRVNGVTEEQLVADLLKETGITTIAMETGVITYDQYAAFKAAIGDTEIVPFGDAAAELRMIKDASELASITKAAQIACKAFDYMLSWMKAGMTEKEVRAELDYTMAKLGSEGPAFATIAVAGVNGSLPHGVPSDHRIAPGELLTLDFGATVNGYRSDMTRTVGFGDVPDELRDIYETVLNAQKMALDAIRPGVCCRDIDTIARNYIDQKYPGCFGHGLGHSVGLFIHEYPRFSQNDETILQPGHVLTVEPGVYVPGVGGCRIEDMVFITEDGFIDPITAPKQLMLL